MDEATANGVTEALYELADELEQMSDDHPGHNLPEGMIAAHAQYKQMLGDARWLRKRAVAIRLELLAKV